MTTAVYDLQGYTIVLDKICFITRVFEAENEEGYQFNARFSEGLVLRLKYPARHEAELQRGLLVKALAES